MNELCQQLFTPQGVLFAPLLAGLLGSLTFGTVGSYVVVRRISYAAHGMAHAVLLGIGAALFFNHHAGAEWISPLAGAVLAALGSGGIIGMAVRKAPHRTDAVVSAVMVTGMAGGLVLLARTPGYFDPMSVLFGDILLVGLDDALLFGGLNLLIAGAAVLFYSRLQRVCFDEEFARLRGINTGFWFQLLLSLTALTVVMMVQITGLVLAVALLTLPVMTALRFGRKLWQVMGLASLLCAGSVFFGLALSFQLDLPTGPVIVLLAAAIYLITLPFRR